MREVTVIKNDRDKTSPGQHRGWVGQRDLAPPAGPNTGPLYSTLSGKIVKARK